MRKRKPCPGCKKVPSHRAADEVCHDCKQLMRDGEQFRADTAQAALPFYAVPSAWPYIAHAYTDWDERHDDHFQRLMSNLMMQVGRPAPSNVHGISNAVKRLDLPKNESSYKDGVVAIPQPVADSLAGIYRCVLRIAEAAYEQGRQEGSNIITQLAKGEMSIDDFNKLSAPPRPKRGKRRAVA